MKNSRKLKPKKTFNRDTDVYFLTSDMWTAVDSSLAISPRSSAHPKAISRAEPSHSSTSPLRQSQQKEAIPEEGRQQQKNTKIVEY